MASKESGLTAALSAALVLALVLLCAGMARQGIPVNPFGPDADSTRWFTPSNEPIERPAIEDPKRHLTPPPPAAPAKTRR